MWVHTHTAACISFYLSPISLPYRGKHLPISLTLTDPVEQKVNEIFFHLVHHHQKYPFYQWQGCFCWEWWTRQMESSLMNLLCFWHLRKAFFALQKWGNHTGNLFYHLTFTSSLLSIISIFKGEGIKLLRQRMMRISALIIFWTWRSQKNEVAMLNIYSFK